jgi:hypothetical protein
MPPVSETGVHIFGCQIRIEVTKERAAGPGLRPIEKIRTLAAAWRSRLPLGFPPSSMNGHGTERAPYSEPSSRIRRASGSWG